MSGLRHEDKIRAILERDSSYDGLFVYGVKTTGIYCRPSYPSRLPKTENIEVFITPENAEEV